MVLTDYELIKFLISKTFVQSCYNKKWKNSNTEKSFLAEDQRLVKTPFSEN